MSETSILAELFTSSHLQHLAWYGSSEVLSASVEIVTRRASTPPTSVADAVQGAFEILRREYPIEYVYKTCTLKKTVFGTYSPSTTALYMEFPVADSRADMLLVNGAATVIEVKTRFDDATRLEAQLHAYYRCFKRVMVLTDEHCAERYVRDLPSHVGVAVLNSRFSITTRRDPTDHTGDLDQVDMYRLLRQNESRQVMAQLGVDLSIVDAADRYDTGLERFSELSTDAAHDMVVHRLRSRQRTERLAVLCAKLPQSLHVGVFSYRLRKRDWDDLISVLEAPP